MARTLITGCSTGIGMATALHMAHRGHQVFATMRNPEGAPELAERAADEGLDIHVGALDVNDDDSVAAAIAAVRAAAGGIDALVNNAGIAPTGVVEEMPLEEFRRVMETNYLGALRCIRAVLPEMRRAASGCIVNVSSVAGRIAAPAQGAYAASKFALEALSESLALEVAAFGVRVALIEPGIVKTPIFDKMQRPPSGTPYSHERRLQALFDAANQNPVSPVVVAEKIEEVIRDEHAKLRHPVGPDAEPFLAWRAAMSDEEWVAWGALDDTAWCARVKDDFDLEIGL